MDYKARLAIAKQNGTTLSKEESDALKSRGAVSNIPLLKGDIIAFGNEAKEFIDIRTINGNKIIMLIGAKLANAADEISDTAESIQISTVAFGRAVVNRNTGESVTPVTVATASGETFNAEKLAYNQLQNFSLADVPNYVAGKKFRILGLQDVGLVMPDGTPRINAGTGQQMFQTVYAFEEI